MSRVKSSNMLHFINYYIPSSPKTSLQYLRCFSISHDNPFLFLFSAFCPVPARKYNKKSIVGILQQT